jgi:hypothetical protein
MSEAPEMDTTRIQCTRRHRTGVRVIISIIAHFAMKMDATEMADYNRLQTHATTSWNDWSRRNVASQSESRAWICQLLCLTPFIENPTLIHSTRTTEGAARFQNLRIETMTDRLRCIDSIEDQQGKVQLQLRGERLGDVGE